MFAYRHFHDLKPNLFKYNLKDIIDGTSSDRYLNFFDDRSFRFSSNLFLITNFEINQILWLVFKCTTTIELHSATVVSSSDYNPCVRILKANIRIWLISILSIIGIRCLVLSSFPIAKFD